MKTFTTRFIVVLALFSAAACTDLDLNPLDTATPNVLFSDEDSYTAFLARAYAGLAITGQQGPSGASDIASIDEGFSSYVRTLWKLQELPTDEAVISWSDPGLPTLVRNTWSADNAFIKAMYYRTYFQVSIANEFLRESTSARLDDRNISEGFRPTIADYRAEARFLRAFSLYHALDLFGTGPLYTEEQEIGGTPPTQASGQEIFAFIEAELAEIVDLLPEAGTAEYGRVDQAAAWMLQSQLFLNAQVYVGQDRASDAAAAAEKVINSGVYSLEEDYSNLFGADNNDAEGIIFAIPFDGDNTQTFGGTTFLVHAPLGGAIDPLAFGVNSGWGGLRTTPEFVSFFSDVTGVTDERAIFFTNGQALNIVDLPEYTQGYAITKWTNLTSEGTLGKDLTFPDTDYPVFRLADAYLNYAEAVLRGGTGDRGQALGYINQLRERAYNGSGGAIADADLDLDFLLEERTRETYWEGNRRTDLRRFGLYTGGDYVWTFKGNDVNGASMQEFRGLYPLPASELVANPNLTQNDGY